MRRLLYILNLGVLIVWVLALLSCYISPARVWYLSFFGLGFLFVIMGLLAFITLWIVWGRRILWVNVVALILSVPALRSSVSFHRASAHEGIKVMSYNVRNFDLYNWSGRAATRAHIMALIAREKPDILCLQEFYTDDYDLDNAGYMRDTLGYKYAHILTIDEKYMNPTHHKINTLRWGTAIFSRYPMVDTGSVGIQADGTNRCQYADLDILGQRLRVYNAHLQSVHLDYEDYDTIDELTENQNTNWYRLKQLVRKLRRAFGKRAIQAETVHQHIASYAGRKILCTDMNDCPVSYTYHTIQQGMQDAFVERGWGIGHTYIHRLGFFRIDYIFTGIDSKVNAYRILPDELSDHYPILAWITP